MKKTIMSYFSAKSSSNTSTRKSRKLKIQKFTRQLSVNDIIYVSSDEDDCEFVLRSKKQRTADVNSKLMFPQKLQLNESKQRFNHDINETEASCMVSAGNKNQKENLSNNSCDNNEHASAIPYYLKNFNLAVDTVIKDEQDCQLFEGDDAKWIKTFYELPLPCQKLYIRLFHRKVAWLPENKV